MSKTVLFQTTQFNISTQFSSLSSMNRALSGATNSGLSRSRGDGYEGYFIFPKARHQIV